MGSSTIRLWRVPGGAQSAQQGLHPKAVLVTGNGIRYQFRYAPREVSHAGWSDQWTTVPRPGRSPLLLADGADLPTMSFTVLIARPDHQQHIEDDLRKLRRIAKSGRRMRLLGMSPRFEVGPWRMTGLQVEVLHREHGTNRATRATVSMSFTQASDVDQKLGPVKGGKKGGRGPKGARQYRVKKGDTLRKIANRFYDDPSKWRIIARASKVKNPRKLRVGQKLTIPPLSGRDDDRPYDKGKGKGR